MEITYPSSFRIKFRKFGNMKYIGHLDVMRYFQKVFRRSGVDIAYTEGFHPHQIMSFANPLGVGLLSDGEYMDVTLNSADGAEAVKSALNGANAEGFEIVSVVALPEKTPNAMSCVAAADYLVVVDELQGYDGNIADVIENFLVQPEIGYLKKTKKGEKTLDLKAGILDMHVSSEGIFMKVMAGSAVNIRPEFVLEALVKFAGADFENCRYTVTREEIYDTAMKPLYKAGCTF